MQKKLKIIILFLGVMILIPAMQLVYGETENKAELYQRITPAEAKAIIESGERFVLLDVRSKEEYLGKHIPQSILLPLDQLEKEALTRLSDPTIPIIVYCQSGRRSLTASQILVKLGYQQVYNLGGITGWPYETISGDNDNP